MFHMFHMPNMKIGRPGGLEPIVAGEETKEHGWNSNSMQ